MIAVPVLFENMYKKVMQGIDKKGKTKTVKFGIKLCKFLKLFGIDYRRKIFKDIHANFGGKLRLLVGGGAALDPETEKGFNELGIQLYQGYGLTETSPVISAEDDKFRRIGSIGKAFLMPDLGMPMSLAPNSIMLKFKHTIMNKYFSYIIQSPYGKKFLIDTKLHFTH